MRVTTANFKNANYDENHDLYVGTHTGSFKKLCVACENPYNQINLQRLDSLTKDSRVTTLSYGNEDKTEILIGRANKVVQIFDTQTDRYIKNFQVPEAPIVGLARYEDKLIAGLANGTIHVLENNESKDLVAGDSMSRMRQCMADKKLIATGGKERQNNLKVFDLERMEKTFTSKNLPNDFLQLEVPLWDSDLGFIDVNLIATCSRYGYVRLFDTRKQRRPVQKYANDDQMSFSCLVAHDNMIYVGTTMGALKAFDTRNFKTFAHTYKGFTGGLSNLCLDETAKYVVSASLDRYVRVHHTDTCVLMYQCYVKSKATEVLVTSRQYSTDRNSQEDEYQQENNEMADEGGSDEEYNEIFQNMQTVSDTLEVSTENIKEIKKRKSKKSDKILKKKKIK